jgi:hypothetical protein
MALRTSSIGCLESTRGIAMPAVDDFTNGNGLYCQKRDNVESRPKQKFSHPSEVSLLGMCIWLAQEDSITAPALPEHAGGTSTRCYYSVSRGDK